MKQVIFDYEGARYLVIASGDFVGIEGKYENGRLIGSMEISSEEAIAVMVAFRDSNKETVH